MEGDRSVTTNQHNTVKNSFYLTKILTTIVPAGLNYADQVAVDVDAGFMIGSLVGESELELHAVLVEFVVAPDGEEAIDLAIHVAEEQDSADENAGKDVSTSEQKLKIST